MPRRLPIDQPVTPDQSHLKPQMSRRDLVVGATAFLAPAGVAFSWLNRKPGAASVTNPTPPQAAISSVGSPVASPTMEATATTVPAATPTLAPATPTPAPVEMFGNMVVVRDPAPKFRGEPTTGGNIRLAVTSGNKGANPAAFSQDPQIFTSYLEPLIRVDSATMEPRPCLASSWEWSEDNTVIEYTLRKGATWHNGKPLTADDVAFSFEVYRDDVESEIYNAFVNLKSVDAVGQDKVRVSLLAPDNNWELIASAQLIMPKSQYEKHWAAQAEGFRTLSTFEWNDKLAIGTGPWKMVARGKTSTEFERNEEYWGEKAHARRLALIRNSEIENRLADWRDGRLDIVGPIPPSQLDEIQDSEGYLYVVDTPTVYFAAFNFTNPTRVDPALLLNPDLRIAISHAVNRKQYTKSVFKGFFRPDRAGTIAQPWANDPSVTPVPYSPRRAAASLTVAGYSTKNDDGIFISDWTGEPLYLSCIVRADERPELLGILDSVSADMAKVGIGFVVERLDNDTYLRRWFDEHSFDLIAMSYTQYAGFTDFDIFGSKWDVRINPQGFNPGNFADPAVDDAINELLKTVDINRQRELLATIQVTVNNDLYGLWFGFGQDLVAVGSDIQGFQPDLILPTWNTSSCWIQPSTGEPGDMLIPVEPAATPAE